MRSQQNRNSFTPQPPSHEVQNKFEQAYTDPCENPKKVSNLVSQNFRCNYFNNHSAIRPKSAFGNLTLFKRQIADTLPTKTRQQLSKEWQVPPSAEDVLNELMKDPFAAEEDLKTSKIKHEQFVKRSWQKARLRRAQKPQAAALVEVNDDGDEADSHFITLLVDNVTATTKTAAKGESPKPVQRIVKTDQMSSLRQSLYEARCQDLNIDPHKPQLFVRQMETKMTGRKYDLRNLQLSQKSTVEISSWLQCRKVSISYLNLSSNRLGDTGFAILAQALVSYNQIVTLNLSMNGLTDNSASDFEYYLQNNTSLVYLILGSAQTTVAAHNKFGVKFGAVLHRVKLPLVHQLTLNQVCLTIENLKPMIDSCSPQKPFFNELNLSLNKFTQSTLTGQLLAKLITNASVRQKHGYSLQRLDLSRNKLGNNVVNRIFQAVYGSQLRFLDVSETGLTEIQDFRDLRKTNSCVPLEQLVLNRNLIDPQSILTLATFLGSFRSLQILQMSHCGLNEHACVVVCDQLKFSKSLRELDLTKNNLTDEVIESGLSILFVPELEIPLESLILAKNQITQKGAQQLLSEASVSPFLKQLDLAENAIEADFADWIITHLKNQAERGFTQLTQVSLEWNSIKPLDHQKILYLLKANQQTQSMIKTSENQVEARFLRRKYQFLLKIQNGISKSTQKIISLNDRRQMLMSETAQVKKESESRYAQLKDKMLSMDTKVDMVRQQLNRMKGPKANKAQSLADIEAQIAALQQSNSHSENLLVTQKAKLGDLKSFVDEYQLPLGDEKQCLKILTKHLQKLQQTLKKLTK